MNSGYRSMTPLPGGGESSNGKAKVIRVLGARLTNTSGTLEIEGTPTGGTFKLSYSGRVTTALAYNASASDVQSALEALSSIGSGNVSCSGGPFPDTPIVCSGSITVGNINCIYGLLAGGLIESIGHGDEIPVTLLDENGDPTEDTKEPIVLGWNWATGLDGQIIQNNYKWMYVPSFVHLMAQAEEDFTDGEGKIAFSAPGGPSGQHPGICDTTDYDITEGTTLYAFPLAGKWHVSPIDCPEV